MKNENSRWNVKGACEAETVVKFSATTKALRCRECYDVRVASPVWHPPSTEKLCACNRKISAGRLDRCLLAQLGEVKVCLTRGCLGQRTGVVASTCGNVHRCFSIASITITTSLSYNFVSDEEIKPSGVKRCFTALTVFKFNLKHCHSLNHGPLAALRAVTETSIQVTPPSKMVLSQCQCQGGSEMKYELDL
eukprot:3937065-Rhodomonas_salina.2